MVLEAGADPNGIDSGLTMLQLATTGPSVAIVQMLLDHGADPRGTFAQGTRHSIHIVCDLTSEPVVKLLLANGLDFPENHESAHMLLQHAAAKGWGDVVSLLLAREVDPNAINTVRWNAMAPLSLAIEYGHVAIVDHLLEHGADASYELEQSASSPLLAALMKNNGQVMVKLLHHGALPDMASTTRLLWVSIRHQNSRGVDLALSRDADPNVILGGPFGGFTALHWAVIEWTHQRHSPVASEEYKNIIKSLLQHGADPNARDSTGTTAAQYAVVDNTLLKSVSALTGGTHELIREVSQIQVANTRPNMQLLRAGGVRPPPLQISRLPGSRRELS